MKFITVIKWNSEDINVKQHDSLVAAELYLGKWNLPGTCGNDHFIAVMVEQQYVIPNLQSIIKR